MYLEAAVKRDGTVLALAVRDFADEGTNLISPCQHSLLKLGNMVNTYRIPAMRYEPYSVMTNKCPSGANRGIGKPFMCFALERMMDSIARRLGRDRIELRRENLVQPAMMPYTTPSGSVIDSGDFPQTLNKLLALIDYESFHQEQRRARAEGRWLGLGLALAVEPSTSNQ